MIINLRGTSGSGKSFIVRELMKNYQVREPMFRSGRKQPVGYRFYREPGSLVRPLYVPGHYETACGGCDTLNGLDYIYELIEAPAKMGWDVIYEGLIVASDVIRCCDLKRRYQLMVIELNTPLNVCIASIQARRDERGSVQEMKESTIKTAHKKMEGVKNQRSRFRDAGVDFRLLNREDALNAVMEAMGWPSTISV